MFVNIIRKIASKGNRLENRFIKREIKQIKKYIISSAFMGLHCISYMIKIYVFDKRKEIYISESKIKYICDYFNKKKFTSSFIFRPNSFDKMNSYYELIIKW
jgi:hypothetical protein